MGAKSTPVSHVPLAYTLHQLVLNPKHFQSADMCTVDRLRQGISIVPIPHCYRQLSLCYLGGRGHPPHLSPCYIDFNYPSLLPWRRGGTHHIYVSLLYRFQLSLSVTLEERGHPPHLCLPLYRFQLSPFVTLEERGHPPHLCLPVI